MTQRGRRVAGEQRKIDIAMPVQQINEVGCTGRASAVAMPFLCHGDLLNICKSLHLCKPLHLDKANVDIYLSATFPFVTFWAPSSLFSG